MEKEAPAKHQETEEKETKEKKEKKQSEEPEAAPALPEPMSALEQLILDTSFNKYDVILLARRWAYELKSKEGESRTLQDLIGVSIKDILSSKVSHKMVRDLPHLRTLKKTKAAPANILEAMPSKPSKDKDEDEE